VLAARRVGVRDVILPQQNEKNVKEDFSEDLRRDLRIHLVTTIGEVLALALNPPAAHADEIEAGRLERQRPDRALRPAVDVSAPRRPRRWPPDGHRPARLSRAEVPRPCATPSRRERPRLTRFVEASPAGWHELAYVHTETWLSKLRGGRLSISEVAKLELPASPDVSRASG